MLVISDLDRTSYIIHTFIFYTPQGDVRRDKPPIYFILSYILEASRYSLTNLQNSSVQIDLLIGCNATDNDTNIWQSRSKGAESQCSKDIYAMTGILWHFILIRWFIVNRLAELSFKKNGYTVMKCNFYSCDRDVRWPPLFTVPVVRKLVPPYFPQLV